MEDYLMSSYEEALDDWKADLRNGEDDDIDEMEYEYQLKQLRKRQLAEMPMSRSEF
jgi:hypothetical protein